MPIFGNQFGNMGGQWNSQATQQQQQQNIFQGNSPFFQTDSDLVAVYLLDGSGGDVIYMIES